MLELFHYLHCPFCVRVRLALGFLKIDYKSTLLGYDDEKTPLKLSGVKMLPILKKENGETLNESLDIISFLDLENKLSLPLINKHRSEVEQDLKNLGGPIHNLCMPYWIWTKEFNSESRAYFQQKKEMKRGPFHLLAQNKNEYLIDLSLKLKNLENKLTPFYLSNEFTVLDIMIASHLWGLYIFPEFQFSKKLHLYLQEIKNKCHFDYHQDLWLTE